MLSVGDHICILLLVVKISAKPLKAIWPHPVNLSNPISMYTTFFAQAHAVLCLRPRTCVRDRLCKHSHDSKETGPISVLTNRKMSNYIEVCSPNGFLHTSENEPLLHTDIDISQNVRWVEKGQV